MMAFTTCAYPACACAYQLPWLVELAAAVAVEAWEAESSPPLAPELDLLPMLSWEYQAQPKGWQCGTLSAAFSISRRECFGCVEALAEAGARLADFALSNTNVGA